MYNLLLRLIYLYVHLPFTGSRNRKKWLLEQKKIFKNLIYNKNKSIWIHCSSLGEYEHIKPLIPELKKINPLITTTFFSPSGYENFKDFHLTNQVLYLPFDLKENMSKFIKAINPMMVIVSKNEIWPNMMKILKNKNTPCFLIGFKIKKSKLKNWLIKRYYIKYLPKFTHVFCQDESTFNFLKSSNINNCSITGDTRVNQVLIDAQIKLDDQKMNAFLENEKKTIIYGSIEKSDYKIIMDFIQSKKNLNHVIVPHEINQNTINELIELCSSKNIKYSELDIKDTKKHNILIVDTFGILKKLYKYANISYIGGGFNQGVHNTLEPAIYGNYMFFGPKYMGFTETHFFIKNKIGFSVNDKSEFETKIGVLLEEKSDNRDIVLQISKQFFLQNKQDIDMILNHIKLNI